MDDSIATNENFKFEYIFNKYPYGEMAKVISVNKQTNAITVEYKSGNKLNGLVEWFNWAFDEINF